MVCLLLKYIKMWTKIKIYALIMATQPKLGQDVKSMAWIALVCIVSRVEKCPTLDGYL